MNMRFFKSRPFAAIVLLLVLAPTVSNAQPRSTFGSVGTFGSAERVGSFAGVTTIKSVGTKAIVLRLNRRFTSSTDDPSAWITFSTSGRYAGIVLQQIRRDLRDLGQLYMRVKTAGCTGVPVVSLHPSCPPIDTATIGFGSFEAGLYLVTVLGDPGSKVTATLHLAGLRGTTIRQATIPVDARFAEHAIIGGPGVMQHIGSLLGSMPGPGLMVGGIWALGSRGQLPDSAASTHNPKPGDGGGGTWCFEKPGVALDPTDECVRDYRNFSCRCDGDALPDGRRVFPAQGKAPGVGTMNGTWVYYETEAGTWRFLYQQAAAFAARGQLGAFEFFFSAPDTRTM